MYAYGTYMHTGTEDIPMKARETRIFLNARTIYLGFGSGSRFFSLIGSRGTPNLFGSTQGSKKQVQPIKTQQALIGWTQLKNLVK